MVAKGSRDKYVTLVASDGFEFVVLREACMVSPALKGMLGTGSML
jgi:elongin-C